MFVRCDPGGQIGRKVHSDQVAIATGTAGWGGTWLELAAVIATLAGLESRVRAAAVPWWWTVVSATFHMVHSRGALYGYVVVAAVTHVVVIVIPIAVPSVYLMNSRDNGPRTILCGLVQLLREAHHAQICGEVSVVVRCVIVVDTHDKGSDRIDVGGVVHRLEERRAMSTIIIPDPFLCL